MTLPAIAASTKSVWHGAWRNAVSTVCGVVLSNVIDPQTMIVTWAWFRHLITVTIVMLTINEARYWKTWAENPDSRNSVVLAFFWSFFVGIAFQLATRAVHLQ